MLDLHCRSRRLPGLRRGDWRIGISAQALQNIASPAVLGKLAFRPGHQKWSLRTLKQVSSRASSICLRLTFGEELRTPSTERDGLCLMTWHAAIMLALRVCSWSAFSKSEPSSYIAGRVGMKGK